MGKAPGLTLQASIVQDNVPVEVAPRLFVGSIHAAFNVDALKEQNISHIVNLAGNYATFPDDFTYLSLSIRDKEYANLLSCLPVALLFVESALSASDDGERGVLIHCAGGRSRSPAVAIAYLMTKNRISYDDALARVRGARSVVSLNAGFEAQLRSLEKADGDVFAAHQLMLQTKMMTLVQERDDGLLDMNLSHTKSSARHRSRHHHMPSTPKSGRISHDSIAYDAAVAACDDRGMIHGTVPCGFSLSIPENASKGQHFIPSLRSMGTLFGCRTCGENLFCASAIIDQCASKDRRVPLNHDTECRSTAANVTEAKTKRPLLAKLRLRPQSPGVRASQQTSGSVNGACKSNPTTPRVAVLKSPNKPLDQVSNATCSQQPTQALSELTKSGSSSDLRATHRAKESLSRTNSGSFWRSLTSFKGPSKRAVNDPDEEQKKKAVLSPKAIAIDLSAAEHAVDGDVTHTKFIHDNTQQWHRKLSQLELSWANLPSSGKKAAATAKALSSQFASLRGHDARTMALLESPPQWCVAPLPWLMRANLQDPKGVIVCPNERCGATLGKWEWEGSVCACGCGHVVLPAFGLDKSAVRNSGAVVSAPPLPGDTHLHSGGEGGREFTDEPLQLHRAIRK